LGYVSAGRPVETPEEQETIRVPSHMTRKASYALRVRGHSMIDDQIQDGDIIVIEQRQTAENGETVVALINGHQVTLKRFMWKRRGSASNRPIPRWRRSISGMRRSKSWGLFPGWCG
jgi:repressor LexA